MHYNGSAAAQPLQDSWVYLSDRADIASLSILKVIRVANNASRLLARAEHFPAEYRMPVTPIFSS